MSRYISVADTAKLIRKALKEQFKGVKFSVRSQRSTIRVEWVDGPASIDVEKVTKMFEGATFDGMTDLKSYLSSELNGEEVHFGADYVVCSRTYSYEFVEAVAGQFCKEFGIPMVEIGYSEFHGAWVKTRIDSSIDHWLWELLCKTKSENMHRAYEAEKERKQRNEEVYAAGAQERAKKAAEEEARYEQERKEREAREQVRREQAQQEQRETRQRQQRARDAFKVEQRTVLATRVNALTYLGLHSAATQADVLKAFRAKVKAMADGKGGYNGDMDFLVKVKERALS